MADNTLSQLTSSNTHAATDFMYLVRSGNSRKITVDNFFRAASNVRLAGNVTLETAQSLAASGTVDLLKPLTRLEINNSGGPVVLPPGHEGQVKFINLSGSDGSGTFWIGSNVSYNGSTANLLFSRQGDSAILGYINSTWQIFTVTNEVMLQRAAAPATSSDNGLPGEIRVDSGFVYVCVAPNTWKRASLSTF